MMEEWYKDSLSRYPRVLLQREQAQPAHRATYVHDSRGTGGNVVRIKVHGRRSGDKDIEPPRVTVRRYNSREKSAEPEMIAMKTVRAGDADTSMPVQVRRMKSTPVTSFASTHDQTRPRVATNEPRFAKPLTTFRFDFNGNPLNPEGGGISTADSSRTYHSISSPEPLLQSDGSSIFQSFEKDFDRFTSEYTSLAKEHFSRTRSQPLQGSSNYYT